MIVWLVMPAREGSTWKRDGMFGSPKASAEAREQRGAAAEN